MIKGNADNDEISGGDGRDKISGGAGNDDINSHDSSKDWVDCGPGHNDYVDADRRDVLSGCEDRD
jgi:serralysin